MNNFVGEFDFKNINVFDKNYQVKLNKLNNNFVFTIDNLLLEEEIFSLIKSVEQANYITVGQDGFLKNYKKGHTIGSYRNSFFHTELADLLFKRISLSYPKRDFIQSLNIDHDNNNKWKLSGVNPLFRTIKYKNNGILIPHYDAPYIKNDYKRTLVSVIIYLTTNKTGSTRFIKDEQAHLSSYDRNLNDWSRKAYDSEILYSVKPKAGNALIFDHRILHDSEDVINEDKIIIRTDLFFSKY